MRKRGWCAAPWLSRATPAVRRWIVVARQWAERLDKPVRGGMSAQQEAFVKALAPEGPGPPHRDCSNHFRRDLAQPVLEMASRAKVKRRRNVRGWRAIERRGLAEQRPAAAPAPTPPDEPSKTAAPPRAAASEAAAPGASSARGVPTAGEAFVEDEEGEVVRGYGAAVRGMLHDRQGGPLHPPGVRMREALQDGRDALKRTLQAHKGGLQRRGCNAWPVVLIAAWLSHGMPGRTLASTPKTAKQWRVS